MGLFWYIHHRTKPYALRFQNALEAWLFAASASLLLLSGIYSVVQIGDNSFTGVRVFFEVSMLFILVASLAAGALIIVHDVRSTRGLLEKLEPDAVLAAADVRIDEPLAAKLRDGSIRLLRCAWLVSDAAQAFIYDKESGLPRMRRRQDLPPDAFFAPQDAAALLSRGDRSVLALSYGWLTAAHPECVHLRRTRLISERALSSRALRVSLRAQSEW